MRRMYAVALVVALLALTAQPGSSATDPPAALYYADFFRGPDPVLPALQAKGFAVTKPASWAAFMQALAGGQYALAIALAQDSDVNGPNATAAALSAHLAAGGAAWLADFTCEASLAAAFQGGCAEATNQQPVTISDANLAAGVANPLPLTNPGWLTWSWSLTASGEAVPLASFPDGSAAVVLGSKGRSALIGFTADSLTGQNGQRLFGNLLDITVPLPPVIPSFQPPSCSAAVGVQVTVPVPATDANGNLVAVSLAWGDGTEDATASFGPTAAHTATFIHTYAARGLYRIAASATDALGATTSRDAACLMAVYGARDTVLGSGSFDSPAGAFAPDASVAGTATFSIRAKYARGASKPSGVVRFNLPSAKLLKFRSSNFDWLVLSGPTKAALKGSTTRKGGFKFLISVIDGDAEGGGGDKIRVKIVEEASGATFYDNQLEGDTADEAPPTAAISSGDILLTSRT